MYEEEPRKQYTIRLPESLYGKIELVARKNKRSINGQIEFMLEEYILDLEQKQGPIVKDKR
jgi:hypothetical protein